MIARAGSGWQTMLADLSLILFITTAAVVLSGDPAAQAVEPSPRAEPVAVYEAAEGAPPLGEWLAEQGADSRQVLTITVRYSEDGPGAGLVEAAKLLQQAGAAAQAARVVVEPGAAGVTAVLAYDRP
ncbi:MAG: hypothetical protein R3D89_07305 [Sphingomonadaceae bacterium]